MTLCEYSMDYGDDSFREKSAAIIGKEIPHIANETIRLKTMENIQRIQGGSERDFFV